MRPAQDEPSDFTRRVLSFRSFLRWQSHTRASSQVPSDGSAISPEKPWPQRSDSASDSLEVTWQRGESNGSGFAGVGTSVGVTNESYYSGHELPVTSP